MRGHVPFEVPAVGKVANSGAWRPGQKLELEQFSQGL